MSICIHIYIYVCLVLANSLSLGPFEQYYFVCFYISLERAACNMAVSIYISGGIETAHCFGNTA